VTPPHPRRRDPLLRARVAVPLTVLAVASLLLLWFQWRGGGGPFGPMQPAPPPDQVSDAGGEVVQWAFDGGIAQYRDGNYDDASMMLGRAVAGLPFDPVPAFYAGVSHLMCERPDAALGLLRSAVDLRPEETLYRYYLAWALHLEGQDEDAAVQLERAGEGEGRWARKARQTRQRLP
jgi:tetratricopeptide (TPR) repeat protein